MELILKEDVPKIGKTGDVVKVKDGYARNYLLPKGLALELTADGLKIIEKQRKARQQRDQELKDQAQEMAQKLASLSCTIAMPSGENDKLFGAVTVADIADALRQMGISIDKKDIVLKEEIHRLGSYHFHVKIPPEVGQDVKLWVVKK